MPIFIARLLARLTLLGTWWTPVLVFGVVFVTSWPLMTLVEPAGSALVEPGNYWWYFVVTASTVGYGDFTPETTAGHVVGAYVIVGGIATLTTVFTRLAAVLERGRGQRMRGAVTVDASGHIVLLGYTPGRTEQMTDELMADGTTRVVVCAWEEVRTHPMPERGVEFVRGDLTDESVLRRAGVHRALSVLVDARDDNEALAVALTADHVTEGAHLVVALRDLHRARHLRYVAESLSCVQWHSPFMITEELRDPGITEIYSELMTHGGAGTHSVRLPASLGAVPVERCQTALGRLYGATMLAARSGDALLVNPDWSSELPAGAVLYYIGARRLTTDELATALR
ncbi:NAD-binding protein [Nonomuraea muscovyensis]|uniref:Voltage-gated potassium channel n=1 Tax=Nonomuraea muscovyensis TaxID=1124761 RepID=A0A7X0C1G3_9ACTN|nr:NAD-binding protein [Nonomuraea muscovyensis]MBB6346735.1 voltage-gated potassium channel [Nonomuraea muscovyensis]MDF2709874.1 voltage-gated potassium channel [Nonomuraea muscovyensis]